MTNYTTSPYGEQIPVYRLTLNQRKILKIVERDGSWTCHYCTCNLIPVYVHGYCEPYHKFVVERDMHPLIYPEQLDAFNRGDLMMWRTYWTSNPAYRLPTIDHKLARAYGGSNDMPNLVLACGLCNSEKSHRYGYEEYKALWVARLGGES